MSNPPLTSTELQDRLAQKTAEARILQQVSSKLNSTLDLDEIFDIVLRTMDELFGFRHSLILLLDPARDELGVVASRGYPENATGTSVPVGTGLVGMVAQKRRMMRFSNVGQQRAYASTIRKQMEEAGRGSELAEVPKLPGLPNAESQIAIPLMIKDTLIGVFSVESEGQRIFSEHDEILVTIVANQAASAIHNARLYRAAEERRQELAEAHEGLKQFAETLERRVRERTEELQRTNRELRETQAQLVQAAKMAALGDLVAGVAHEINTPLGSVRASSDVARRAAKMVGEALGRNEFAALVTPLAKLASALQSLDEATSTTLAASDRIVEIMKSLRRFARLDEAERKKVDLHEGIDSALALLRYKLKEGIEVVKDYGDLPAMDCFPSRLNQVFMNILVNALEAIEAEGRITITTRKEGDHAILQFADTGRGIRVEHLERIFDPGFTTKGVGVGTGLGLSISYRIIADHRGSITVSSEPRKGAVFTIRLPIET